MACATEAENALLRETVGRLEAIVADKCEEIELLKSQLAFLKSNGVGGAQKSARGSLQDAADEVPPKGTRDAPVFPNEVFLLIATHLEPGTRSLLDLARSCRALYALLPPDLRQSYHDYAAR